MSCSFIFAHLQLSKAVSISQFHLAAINSWSSSQQRQSATAGSKQASSSSSQQQSIAVGSCVKQSAINRSNKLESAAVSICSTSTSSSFWSLLVFGLNNLLPAGMRRMWEACLLKNGINCRIFLNGLWPPSPIFRIKCWDFSELHDKPVAPAPSLQQFVLDWKWPPPPLWFSPQNLS